MIVDLIDLLLIVEDGDRDVEDLPEVGDKVRVLADRTKAGSGSGDRDACRVKNEISLTLVCFTNTIFQI